MLAAVVALLLAPTVAPTAASAAPGDSSTAAPEVDPQRPVRVTLTTLEPRTITPGVPITVSGTLTNDGDQTITDITLRLQRGDRLATRAELAADLAEPTDDVTATAAFGPVTDELQPGGDVSFSYATTSDELQLGADAGSFPALVNVNGSLAGGAVQRVGQLATHLVVQPATPTAVTAVTFLWPITDRPHRGADGTFTDDDLAGEIATGGRLDRALASIELLPAGRGDPVTLAVDPALTEELASMAAGDYQVRGADGSTTAGEGSAAATAFLSRLQAAAAVHPVLALPYADADLDALQAAGGSAAVLRTLPGSDEGTAQAAGGDTAGPATPATAAPTGEPGTDGETDGTTVDGGAGARILQDALGVAPRTDIAWPVDGELAQDTLSTLLSGGVEQVVLAEAAVTGPGAAVSDAAGSTAPASPRAEVSTADGVVPALIADSALGATLAGLDRSGRETAGGDRATEQTFLAELSVLTTQLAAGGGTQQSVLVVPPRTLDVDPAAAAALLHDTGTQPWLLGATLAQVEAGPAADVGELTPDGDGDQLAGPGLSAISSALATREDFATAVVDDPAGALAPYDAAISRATAASWRTDPAGFPAAAQAVGEALADLRGQVSLLAPADGTYTLASQDAPLVLTVSNELPFAVQVQLDLRALGSMGLTTDDIGLQQLLPGTRTTLQVPAQVRQSGGVAVTARLSTPGGGSLGSPVEIQVKSTAYGRITLVITIGAAALLALLFLRRLVLMLLRRHRGEGPDVDEAPAGPGTPDGTAGPGGDPAWTPPARSPV